MKITITGAGMPIFTTEWDGDLLSILGMILGMILGSTEVITVPGTTAVGIVLGIIAAGTHHGIIVAGIHPGTMEDGMILGTMDMADTLMVAVITMVLTMDITAV